MRYHALLIIFKMTSIEETFTEYLKNACYAIHTNNINYRLKYVTLFDSSVFDDIPDNVKSFVLHLPLHVYQRKIESKAIHAFFENSRNSKFLIQFKTYFELLFPTENFIRIRNILKNQNKLNIAIQQITENFAKKYKLERTPDVITTTKHTPSSQDKIKELEKENQILRHKHPIEMSKLKNMYENEILKHKNENIFTNEIIENIKKSLRDKEELIDYKNSQINDLKKRLHDLQSRTSS